MEAIKLLNKIKKNNNVHYSFIFDNQKVLANEKGQLIDLYSMTKNGNSYYGLYVDNTLKLDSRFSSDKIILAYLKELLKCSSVIKRCSHSLKGKETISVKDLNMLVKLNG